MTGAPQLSASISTVGNPSHLEESTNAVDRAMYAYGLLVAPGRSTSSSIPSRRTSASSFGRSGPSPRITRRAAPPCPDTGERVQEHREVLLWAKPARCDEHRAAVAKPRVVDRRARLLDDVVAHDRVEDHAHLVLGQTGESDEIGLTPADTPTT